jgi:streptogramin lyase
VAATSSHTLKRPRTAGFALVLAAAIGAAALVTVVLTRGGSSRDASVPEGQPAPMTAPLPVTVVGTQGAQARVTTFSDPDGRLDAPRDLTVGPDGNVWFTANRTQLGRVTPSGEITLYSDPAGLIDSPDSIVTGADGALWFTSLGDRIGRITTSGDITSFPVGGGDAWGPTGTSGSRPRATRSAG